MEKPPLAVVTFREIYIRNAFDSRDGGWVVQRTDPDGFAIVVTRVFETEHDATSEASRLNLEASRRIMN